MNGFVMFVGLAGFGVGAEPPAPTKTELARLTYFRAGEAVLRAGRYAEGESALTAALDGVNEAAGSTEAYLLRGLARERPGRQADAEQDFRRAETTGRSRIQTAHACAAGDKMIAVRRFPTFALGTDPNEPCCDLMARVGTAWSVVWPASAALPTDAQKAHAEGVELFNKGKYKEAEERFTAALAVDPTSGLGYRWRAAARAGQQRWADAVADCDQAIKIEPKNARAHMLRGTYLLGLGKHAAAIADFDRAIALGEQATDAQKAHAEGVELFNKGKYKEAEERFTAALAVDPTSGLGYRWRAAARAGQQRWADAVADCDQAIKIEPKNAQLHTLRGYCRIQLRKYAAAITDLDRAIELGDQDLLALVGRAEAHAGVGDKPKALADYAAALKRDPKFAPAYRFRARFYRGHDNDNDKFLADDVTADLLGAGAPVRVQGADLERSVSEWLAAPGTVTLVVAVPQFDEVSPIVVHALVAGKVFRAEVVSQAVWDRVVNRLADRFAAVTRVDEWDVHDTPFFKTSRGVRVVFESEKTREVAVAPGRTLKLTAKVLNHFQVIRESDYPSTRTAVIITEAHDSVGAQISSFHGLDQLVRANPWLKDAGETAFLVEAWESGKPLSVKPLTVRRPNPSDPLVHAALETQLIPSYVAFEWKHRLGIPLIGHEDMKLYKFCNYMHWATAAGKWSGRSTDHADTFMGLSVVARNASSAETLLKALADYKSPILFIGHGHVGPYDDDTQSANPKKNLAAYGVTEKDLTALLPGEPTAWLTATSRQSVASYLKAKGIGFVLLQPRDLPTLGEAEQTRQSVDYLALRKAQHDGKTGLYLERYKPQPNDNCTTMPDPDGLADILPDLESADLGSPFTAQVGAEQFRQMLGDCGTSLGCFPAGTVVRTESGPRPVERVREGERVWARNPRTGDWALCKVTATLRGTYDGDFVTLTAGSTVVTATGTHPFWVASGERLAERPAAADMPAAEAGDRGGASGRWVNARDLKVGDVLLAQDGRPAAVSRLDRRTGRETVYTLRVDEAHTFAVGDAGLLVHNKCEFPAGLLRGDQGGLRKSLTDSYARQNGTVPKGVQAHHLIPVAAAQKSALLAHAAEKFGYSVNRARNGIFLRNGPEKAGRGVWHRGSHPKYSEMVGARLNRLDARFIADRNAGKEWNSDRTMKAIGNLERSLRQHLQTSSGRLARAEPHSTDPTVVRVTERTFRRTSATA